VGETLGTSDRLVYGVPASPQARDGVDNVLLQWAEERPDLDFTPVGVITRLATLRTRLDAELAGVFARHGLTHADFSVIVTLRRIGRPYAMPQARLMEALGLTSGTISVRLDRLERRGIVAREPDPGNGRGSVVHLTIKGLDLFDRVAPAHLENEDRLLSALSAEQRQELADLLRRLVADFQARPPQPAEHLGVLVEPAHAARTRRAAVGLSDEVGLLVATVRPGSNAARAGIERGDLITRIAGTPLSSTVDLAFRLDELGQQRKASVDLLRGNDPIVARLALTPV
jgi:DNA-binding MarR family transcriptional regulator